jgi:hypothetical protein
MYLTQKEGQRENFIQICLRKNFFCPKKKGGLRLRFQQPVSG